MSLKVIENGTIGDLRYGFLLDFYSNYDRIFSRFVTIHERDSQQDGHTLRRHTSRYAA